MTTSSAPRTGSTPRRTTSLAALMALVVAFSFGFVASAGAEPTPVESPSATPTDPGTPDPTADPDVTPSTSSSPTQSTPAPSQDPTTPAPSTPDPSESADEDADEDADGSEAPTPTAEPSGHQSAGSKSRAELTRAAAAMKGRMLVGLDNSYGATAAGISPSVVVSGDGNLVSLGIPSCAPVGGTAVLDQVVGYVDYSQVSQPESLAWEITGPEFSATGSVTPTEDLAEFSVSGIPVGDYALVYRNDGEVLLEDAFTVIGCVTVTVSCAAISFTNPLTNPEVSVIFGGLADDDFDDDLSDELTVPPGRTVTGYTGEKNIGWVALWSDAFDFEGDEPEGIFRFSYGGTDPDVDIPQDGCAAEILSAVGSCVDEGDRGAVEIRIAKLEPVALFYEIWAPSGRDAVADGEIAPGSTQVIEDVRVPSAGDYELRVFVEYSFEPYDSVDFTLGECGPSSAPTADEDDSTAGGAAPVSGGGAVLADTGASTGPLGLMGIALLLTTGAAMVIKGRRSQLS